MEGWKCRKCGSQNPISVRDCGGCNEWRPLNFAPKRKGDWECCGEIQFASRKKCRRCDKEKTGEAPPFRHGDWLCVKCKDHQFASRTECRKCGSSRPVREDKDGEEINPCIICYERERNVLFLHGNDGHFICCKECATGQAECPVCRRDVEKLINVY